MKIPQMKYCEWSLNMFDYTSNKEEFFKAFFLASSFFLY